MCTSRSGALARGGDVHGRVAVRPGGTSANAAVWASWAGASSGVIAAVGDDLAGDLLRRTARRTAAWTSAASSAAHRRPA